NMGPRAFMRRGMAKILPERMSYDYVGRQLRAATGEGYSAAHKREQARIVRVALDLEEDRLEPDSSAQRPVMERRAESAHRGEHGDHERDDRARDAPLADRVDAEDLGPGEVAT